MIPYDKTIIPAAPFANVICANPYRKRKHARVAGLLDTGADVTALPTIIVDALGLEVKRVIGVSGLDTEIVATDVFEVNVEIAGYRIDRLEVIEWAGDYIVLGRDVLNEFYIILDGQMKQFDMKAM